MVGGTCRVVKAKEGDGDAHDHLRYLHSRDNHGIEPTGSGSDGHEKVVSVHGGVDGVVHDDKENSRRGFGDVTVPAVEEDRNVMVPV